jgi:CHASE3 domain sensor protein
MVLVGVAGYQTTTAVEETSAWVTHTHEVIEALGAERVSLAEAAAMRRAHGLTGDKAFVDGYAQAVGRVRAAWQLARTLTQDRPTQQHNLDVLRRLIDQRQRMDVSNAAIARKQRGVDDSGLETAQMSVGRSIDNQISSLLARMVNEERELLVQRRQRTADNVRELRLFLVAGTIVSLATLLTIFRRLQREILWRTESERATRANEENLATTLMSISDGVISADTRGCVTRMNRVAEQLTGWNASAAVGKPVSQVFRIVHEDTRLPVPDPVADSCAPIRDAQAQLRGAVLVFRDISEAQQTKKLQDRVQRQMYFTDRMAAVGTLAAGVAHEINNPPRTTDSRLRAEPAGRGRRGTPWAGVHQLVG